uniref:Polyprenyldihydroxybenzoate methyltransferase n=1 Tax=Meloidogyne hapla TaxID=6305 RepID=A0A1I8B6I5_MELHA
MSQNLFTKVFNSQFVHIYDRNLSDPLKALQSMNRLRVPWISSYISQDEQTRLDRPLEGSRILDVGCGPGILSLALGRLGAEVVGIDEVQSAINLAQKASLTLHPELRTNTKFVTDTIENFALNEDNHHVFDAVVASEVAEHVKDLHLFVKTCCKLAKPNSPLFFTTINRTLCSWIFALIAAEDILRLLPKGLHEYEKFVKPEELRRLLVDEQCRLGHTRGMFYNPLTDYWSWTDFTGINYGLVAFTKPH